MYNWAARVLLCDIMSVFLFIREMTFAMVYVLPLPVTPSRVWQIFRWSRSSMLFDNFSIASGWSPLGAYELSVNMKRLLLSNKGALNYQNEHILLYAICVSRVNIFDYEMMWSLMFTSYRWLVLRGVRITPTSPLYSRNGGAIFFFERIV